MVASFFQPLTEEHMKHTRVALIATAIVAATLPVAGLTLGSASATNDKVWLCHATSSETNPNTLNHVSRNALNGHFDENGTPLAGHEDDLLFEGDKDHPPTQEQCPTRVTTTTAATTVPPTDPPLVADALVDCISTGPDYVSWQLTNTGQVNITSPVALAPGEFAVIESLKNEQGSVNVTVEFADGSTADVAGTGETCVFVVIVTVPTVPATDPPTTVGTTLPPVTDPPVTDPTTTAVAPNEPTIVPPAPFEGELPPTL